MMRATRHLLAALGLLASTAAIGQVAPPVGAGGFSEIVDVRVVNLEVAVTDRDGVPIRGLGAEHFELLVDGEPVPIEYFSEVLGGRAVVPAAGEETEAVPGLR